MGNFALWRLHEAKDVTRFNVWSNGLPYAKHIYDSILLC
jgi:hypothetical protein